MRIGFNGRLDDGPEIRAGFIGCGSHAFRNIYPTFQFAPVRLVAVCDLDRARADAFAAKFGAEAAYDDHQQMLARGDLDAVFIVVGYDAAGRPAYPGLVVDSLEAGLHVWLEKPPAHCCAEVERMQAAAAKAQRQEMVGLKKMFFPANEKAKELMDRDDFGRPQLGLFQYPQHVPTVEEMADYLHQGKANGVRGFLDHLCHPASLMLYLLGMPDSLYYERSSGAAGVATFTFPSGAVASLALTRGAGRNAGMERTTIVSDSGKHIVVDNNLRVSYHRSAAYAPGTGYGTSPHYYSGEPQETSAVWEPEFSLGQLYNKGLFLLGYYNEVAEFARSVLEQRAPCKATLEHAWQVTRIFEAFAEGPAKVIALGATSPR